MPKLIYTIAQFRRRYNVSKSTVYREIRGGNLTAIKRGYFTFITVAEAKRWYAERQKFSVPDNGNPNHKSSFFKSFLLSFFRKRKMPRSPDLARFFYVRWEA